MEFLPMISITKMSHFVQIPGLRRKLTVFFRSCKHRLYEIITLETLQICYFLSIYVSLNYLWCRSPHPHVKHYHIKQNSRGDFFLSEKHCCATIPDLVNYHRHNSGGLASRLKTSPCDRPVPATAGLSHGQFVVV